MTNYEVTDLFEVGSAGSTIQDKGEPILDEVSQEFGPEGLDEE